MTELVPRRAPPRSCFALEQAGIHPLLARIYAARGVSRREQVDYRIEALLRPDELKGIDVAANLLADAVQARRATLIVADYDCDGATACAVALRGLSALGGIADYVVPNRFEHGYGLSPEVVRLAAARKPEVLVTVDSGMASFEGVDEARRLGIATLITDHHLPADDAPRAEAIVNPNQTGCRFPSKDLAGVGVIFYVLLATRAELRRRGHFAARREPNLAELLDLVALGTIADVVRLDHNNRLLVSQGLQRMRAGRCQPGVRALLQVAGRDPASASTFDLGFAAGPRLNAAGRLADMGIGIECLFTDDPARALNIARQLDALNQERRLIEADMQDQATELLDRLDATERASLVLYDPSWHQGVVGLLASRVMRDQHRPVIAFARSGDGLLRGSGRSIPVLHLRDALDRIAKRHPRLIPRFGGHAAAAGLTLREDDLNAFERAFEEVARDLLGPADLLRRIETDGAVEGGHLSLQVARLIDQDIWGQGFPAPLFDDRFEVENQRLVKGKHLKLTLRRGRARLDAIRFNHREPAPRRLHAAFRIAENEFNGASNVQLVVEHFEEV